MGEIRYEGIEWGKYIARDPSSYRSVIVASIRERELRPEIIKSIKCDNHLKIRETLRYLRAQSSCRLETGEIASLYPWTEELCDEEDTERREECCDTERWREYDDKYSRTDDEEKIREELCECLSKKLIEFVSIIIYTRDEIACFILIKKSNRQLLYLRKELVT